MIKKYIILQKSIGRSVCMSKKSSIFADNFKDGNIIVTVL